MSVKMEEDEEEPEVKYEKPEVRKRNPTSYEEPLSSVIEEITIVDDSSDNEVPDETEESDEDQVKVDNSDVK